MSILTNTGDLHSSGNKNWHIGSLSLTMNSMSTNYKDCHTHI